MEELAGSSWFSSLDLNSGFHQIRLKPGEEPKTTFQTHFGHYEFRVMSFGLCGSPGTFHGAMNTTLQPLWHKCVLVFFDDILIYSKSYEEHVYHIRAVLELLSKDKWQIKLSKCSFAQRQLAYLGHVISAEGISTDAKELRGFLGLAGYYRKFVHHFAIMARSLSDLLKKHALFIRTRTHQAAFDALKVALSSAPVLAIPDFSRPFCIETDACNNRGSTNWVVDALSHRPQPVSDLLVDNLLALSSAQPAWSTAIIQGYASDSHLNLLLCHIFPCLRVRCITKVAFGSVPMSLFNNKYSTAFQSHRVHSRFPVTYRRLKQLFAWHGMKSIARKFVTGCLVCQQAKPDRSKMPGLLPLPASDPFLFWQEIHSCAHFWQEFFRLAGVSLRMSSSYHPQTDGQTKRVNQCLETFLRCYVHACTSRWSMWLASAEYWYKISFRSAIGRSPFEVLYGHSPRSLGFTPSDACEHTDLSDWLKDKELMNRLLQQHLLHAQQRMKKQAD
ncbi:hypothetical protein U9M48_035592 [Paspalum notatum var. saurae]|uniref:Integrase catalytic domain-containing protein n=1 Tax=Paspalum notatum var. saurae TaxID=547442 RepID=A0AAQ3UFQ5_PASNO